MGSFIGIDNLGAGKLYDLDKWKLSLAWGWDLSWFNVINELEGGGIFFLLGFSGVIIWIFCFVMIILS